MARSLTNMWPGLWVIINGTRELIATAWGVTPQAQKTGTSPGASSSPLSPNSDLDRSVMPMDSGAPTCTGVPWFFSNRDVVMTTSLIRPPGMPLAETTRGPLNDPAGRVAILVV